MPSALTIERKRILATIRATPGMADFSVYDLDYSSDSGFTIDGQPWEQWLSAMAMN